MAREKMLLTKKVLDQILREYSVGKNDFTQLGGEGHSYLHVSLKGYMLTVAPEQQMGEETGRIQVRHTAASGRIQYTDTWVKGEDGKVGFLCRDTPQSIKKKPDYFYVQELEQENAKLKNAYLELKASYEELQAQKECVKTTVSKDTIRKKLEEVERENAALQEAYEELLKQKECVKTKDSVKKKFGRPPLDEALAEQILNDCNTGMPKTQIARKYKIERKTIYNLLKRREKESV